MSELSTTEAVRQKVLEDAAGRCCVCAPHIAYQVEVVPITSLTEGGTYIPSNLAALCPFCRWLVQRQKISASALRTFRKHWAERAAKAAPTHREHHLTVCGQPLRLEADHKGVTTVLEGSELTGLLANFFNCLDTFLAHEDQHLENAASLAVIRAFRDMYNYVPPERDIKDLATADSRKLDLLYRGIRLLFSVGLAGKAPAAKKPAASKPVKKAARVAKPAPTRKKVPAKKAAPAKPAKAKPKAKK